jgi:hypothetical protein
MPRAAIGSALAALALALAGCSGSGGSSNAGLPVPAGTPPPPVLVAGATYQYAGTETVAITYASPSPTTPNSSAAYTYVANETVSNAPAGAPAPFDVNRATTYTTTQQPLAGTQLLSATNDNYESQTFSGSTETIALAGTKSTTVGIDLSAGLRLGNGPFNSTNTTTTTYATPQTIAIYPLQSGVQFPQPLARTVQSIVTDTNAGGTIGGGGTTTTTYNGDGSFTRTANNANGSTQQQTVTGNATATQIVNQTNGTIVQTAIGGASNGTIPVVVTTNGTAKTMNAADWYPNGVAPSPLAVTTRTVKGPVALPPSCAVTGTPPPVTEVDLAASNLDPLASNTTMTEAFYVYNGVNVCRTMTQTVVDIDITTGLPTSTTVTSLSEALGTNNQGITALRSSR